MRSLRISNATTGPMSLAKHLLASYDASSPFFLASPHGTMLARGVRAVVQCPHGASEPRRLLAQVDAMLRDVGGTRGDRRGVLVGAVPFDPSRRSHLVVPRSMERAGFLDGAALPRERSPDPPVFAMRPFPSKDDYLTSVRQALRRIRRGQLQKVVLARSMELTAALPVDVATLLRTLVAANTGAYTFAVDVSEPVPLPRSFADVDRFAADPRRTLIGASPELLVSRSGLDVLANPLAGSRARSGDPIEDRRRGVDLLGSTKDRREHAFVVEAVGDALRPFCRELVVPREPGLIRTAAMWHLSSRIRGRLRDPSACSLTLAMALHPTPAVCGTPTAAAQATIRELEHFDRDFYTGLVGWCDAAGDGEWVVTIRCGEVEDRCVRLFAGAGIVDGSSAEDEFSETSAKFRTLLSALGLAPSLSSHGGRTARRELQPYGDAHGLG